MTSRELLNKLHALTAEMKSVVAEMEQATKEAYDVWPDYAVVKNFGEWRDRSETPPVGPIWASDGFRVWLIHCDGKPISASATAVKFWTAALIPAPPVGPVIDHTITIDN